MENGMFVNRGTLNISIRNISEFDELLNRARKQSDELKRTLDDLSTFDLKIDFDNKKETN